MKNIHILQTSQPSRLAIYDGGLKLGKQNWNYEEGDVIPQNQYITSDEENVYDKDYYLYEGSVFQARPRDEGNFKHKVILTTDQALIKDGVQAIDDEFLEWFVKNPSCEVVEVIKTAPIRPFGSLYKIIIPKEEPITLGKTVPKERVIGLEEPKQETLEEAAERYYNNYDKRKEEFAFIDGAKWQQERSYSDEEVLSILIQCSKWQLPQTDEDLSKIKEWFEQFKKK